MNLFDLDDNVVTYAPQALVLKPFKALWDRDKSKDKSKAVNELAYVYYFCDFRSDFRDTVDDDDRHKQIIPLLDLPKGWKIDAKVRDAIELYDNLQESMAIQSLNAAKVGLDKVNKFILTVNLDERDKNGKPVYNPSIIDNSIAKIHTRLEQLAKVEEEVKKQIESKADNQGTMEAATFEDGIPD